LLAVSSLLLLYSGATHSVGKHAPQLPAILLVSFLVFEKKENDNVVSNLRLIVVGMHSNQWCLGPVRGLCLSVPDLGQDLSSV